MLEEPTASRFASRIDPLFLDNLKLRKKEDTSKIGILPFAVVCTNIREKENFEEQLKNLYKYEIHGSVHTLKAKQGLIEEGYLNPKMHIWCNIYSYLDDEETLWLPSCHNINGHFSHKISHRNHMR